MAKCKRCGKCCQNFFLPFTPEQLWASYENWLGSKGGWQLEKVYLVAPMVRLVRRAGNGGRYRCVHYEATRTGKGKCGIHKHRPPMCKEYPFYNLSEEIRRNEKTRRHTGLFSGCAFEEKE